MRPQFQPLQGGSGRAPQNPQLLVQQQLLLQQQQALHQWDWDEPRCPPPPPNKRWDWDEPRGPPPPNKRWDWEERRCPPPPPNKRWDWDERRCPPPPPYKRRVLQQQQNTPLNAAIRELQQKTQQNQHRHPLRQHVQGNTAPNQLHHSIRPPQAPAALRPPNLITNLPSTSPAAVAGQSPRLQLQINLPGMSPIGLIRPGGPSMLNQNIRGQSNKFLNPSPLSGSVPPSVPIPPHMNNNNSNNNHQVNFNRTSSPLSAPRIPLISFDPSSRSGAGGSKSNDKTNCGASDAANAPQDLLDFSLLLPADRGRDGRRSARPNDGAERRRDREYREAIDPKEDWGSNRNNNNCSRREDWSSSSQNGAIIRTNSHKRGERDEYGLGLSSDSKGKRRSRSRSREMSSKRHKDRSRSKSRDERKHHSRHHSRDDHRDREQRSNKRSKYDKDSRPSSRERRERRTPDRDGKYGKDEYRDRPQSSKRDEKRSQSIRSDRSSRSSATNISESRSSDRSRSSRPEKGLSPSSSSSSSSHSRREGDTHSRSDSSSRRSEDIAGGLSQYRKDLLKAEFERELDEFLGKKRAQDHMLDEEKWNTDMRESGEEGEDEVEEEDKIVYIIRSCPADLYFSRNRDTLNMEATKKMLDLEKKFEENIVKQADKVRAAIPEGQLPPSPSQVPPMQSHSNCCHCHSNKDCTGADGKDDKSASESSSEEEGELNDDDDEDFDDPAGNHMMREWERRKKHPLCLHPELWYNETGQVNDGPLCRCSIKSRKSGIRHDVYPGEKSLSKCVPSSNNLDRLHHYRVTMSPYTNFLTKTPTVIEYDSHEYIFEGFSLFTHIPLENIPPCKVLRFNIEYTIHFIPESPPENFTVRSLDLFSDYVFTEVLELLDLDWGVPKEGDEGCRRFHFMPRFCRSLPDSGCKEVLSMSTVLSYLIKSSKPLVDESRAKQMMRQHDESWRSGIGAVRGMIVTKPGMKPSSVRVDQLDRNTSESDGIEDDLLYPLIIHQGYRPAQLSYSGDPMYRRAWKQYVQFRHLLNSKPKIFPKDKLRLKQLEDKLQDICYKNPMKREVTVEVSAQGFLCTGLRADLCQHALMIPVLMSHLRFHICLTVLEKQINYQFKDRTLLQLALTHTSYRTNFGTNPDHTRNSLTNCGMRQVEYGDRRVHYQNRRKRGICILLDIMSRFGRQEETMSDVPHNERLEFLGDAVIEFLTSVHLFFMFPWLEEGGLSTYRMALVQNQHLTELAKKLQLQDFMLYVHGPDLCHESDLRHAMANCCEALMGSLFLDGGLEVVDAIFSKTLFDDEDILLNTWVDMPKHVLQQAEPGGDRHWVKSVPVLQKLKNFEDSIGVRFNHVRLLAKSFTHRNIGDNPLTMGHNQRLEFLGDTVLQLVASEYLYRHYPEHHEGHLSLLRSSLVNGRTQALVYDDLGMGRYVIYNEGALADGLDMKTKQKADMLEAFMGALYVDKGLDHCWAFCNVCFFPRLKDFILNQDWNDPKSQLQQCCLTLREVGGGEPDIPIYKMIESIGPTNSRKYVVAVYFRGTRLATGTGHTIQQSEMVAASNALEQRSELFPILQHQKRFLEKMKQGFLAKEEGEIDENDKASQAAAALAPPGSRKMGSCVRRQRKYNNKNNNGNNDNNHPSGGKRQEKMFTQKAESRLKEPPPPPPSRPPLPASRPPPPPSSRPPPPPPSRPPPPPSSSSK